MKSLSQYDALIFDMDGTLVDNMHYHHLSWIALFKEFHLPLDMETFEKDYHRGTLLEVMARLFPLIQSREELLKIGERKEELYRNLYRPHLSRIDGLLEFLQKAQNLHIPMGLSTMGDQTNISFTLGGLGLDSFFTAKTGGDQVTHGKPHPEIFLQTAHKLGVDAKKCLAFEDTQSGITAALAAGMQVVGIATQFSIAKLLDLGCVFALKDYNAIDVE